MDGYHRQQRKGIAYIKKPTASQWLSKHINPWSIQLALCRPFGSGKHAGLLPFILLPYRTFLSATSPYTYDTGVHFLSLHHPLKLQHLNTLQILKLCTIKSLVAHPVPFPASFTGRGAYLISPFPHITPRHLRVILHACWLFGAIKIRASALARPEKPSKNY